MTQTTDTLTGQELVALAEANGWTVDVQQGGNDCELIVISKDGLLRYEAIVNKDGVVVYPYEIHGERRFSLMIEEFAGRMARTEHAGKAFVRRWPAGNGESFTGFGLMTTGLLDLEAEHVYAFVIERRGDSIILTPHGHVDITDRARGQKFGNVMATCL